MSGPGKMEPSAQDPTADRAMDRPAMGDQAERSSFVQRALQSGHWPALLLALVVCIVSVPFMISRLPVEDGMGALGVAIIYLVFWLVLAGIMRMIYGNARNIARRVARKGPQAS